MKKLYLLLPAILFLVFTSCNEEEGDPGPDTEEMEAPCMVLEENRSSRDGFNDQTATVEYDAKGQITTLTHSSQRYPELIYKYERNPDGKISKMQGFHGAGTEAIMEVAMEYDPQGKWTKATSPATGAHGVVSVLIEYEHDSQGNIIKSTRTVDEDWRTETEIKTYEYTNGNMARMSEETNFVYKQGSADSYDARHYEYEYYLDKPAFPLEFDYIRTPSSAMGTPSKNLVKRVTLTRPYEEDARMVTDYTYKLNEAGMPVRTTRSSTVYQFGTVKDLSADSVVVTRSYRCE